MSEMQNRNQKKADEKRKGARTRNWTCIVYPESAPDNWRSIIDDYHIEWVESPLHDRDINADNLPKKAHWHIALCYESVKTYEQVEELTCKLNAPAPQKCNGLKGLIRYMVHIDNPEKYQYSINDIIGHGGIDVTDMFRPSASQRYDIIADMMSFVCEQNIFEMQDLMDYARRFRRDSWFPLLCDNSSYVMDSYIKSKRHRNYNDVIFNENGQVLHIDCNGEVQNDNN